MDTTGVQQGQRKGRQIDPKNKPWEGCWETLESGRSNNGWADARGGRGTPSRDKDRLEEPRPIFCRGNQEPTGPSPFVREQKSGKRPWEEGRLTMAGPWQLGAPSPSSRSGSPPRPRAASSGSAGWSSSRHLDTGKS